MEGNLIRNNVITVRIAGELKKAKQLRGRLKVDRARRTGANLLISSDVSQKK